MRAIRVIIYSHTSVAREMVAELVYRGFSDAFKAVNSIKDSPEFNASKFCMWKPILCTRLARD